MTAVFLQILEMSITAGILVLAVILARLLLRKAPKWIHVLLWSAVAVRLIFPFSPESSLSLLPHTVHVQSVLPADHTAEMKIPSAETLQSSNNPSVLPASDENVTDNVKQSVPNTDEAAADTADISIFQADADISFEIQEKWISVAAAVWIAGMACIFLYAAYGYCRIYGRVHEAVRISGSCWACDRIDSPFILGVFRPRIYLPCDIDPQDMVSVVAHEEAHLKRFDHVTKPAAFFLLAVYWFNPLLWLAYALFCRDMEMACDERVIRSMGTDERKQYAMTLINCSAPRRITAASPLAFSESVVKGRIRQVLHYKKPSFWILLTAVIVGVVLALGFLTDPIKMDHETKEAEEAVSEWIASDSELDEAVQADTDDAAAETENPLLDEISAAMELTAAGTAFQAMAPETAAEILREYDGLLEGYELLARESRDGAYAYILGVYSGNAQTDPLHRLTMVTVSAAGTEYELFYPRDEEMPASTEQIPVSGDGRYVIRGSRTNFDPAKGTVLIQPKSAENNLTGAYQAWRNHGAAYIADTVSRGVSVLPPEGPYLEVPYISEKYGEIIEYIPVSKADAEAMKQESAVSPVTDYDIYLILVEPQTDVDGAARNGENVFRFINAVPPSVMELLSQKCGYRFENPGCISEEIVEARLDCDWLDESRYADQEDLASLRQMLAGAKQIGVGACGYGAKLTVTLANGETHILFKASDDCSGIIFGSYGGYNMTDAQNEAFWRMFGLPARCDERMPIH